MGVINTYFIASSHEAAAAAVGDGPAGLPAVDAVDATVQAGTLLALLTGRDYDEIVSDRSWARLVSNPDDESAWVVSMPDSFTSALAAASDEKLAEVVGPWSQTEEFWGSGDPEQLLPMLREWRDLARRAADEGAALYCWMAL
ncbi:hypothetical protein U746_2614 [Mycolicibacterium mucogenicum 261Sha1.1M5]|nr:hypothetical protein U746_2614 [Mycolicibacterium mucogenicum 261Sha1.1M5]